MYNVVLNIGIAGIASGTASLIVNFAPVLVALLARFFLGERLRLWGWVGSAISLAGVAVIAAASGSGIGVSTSALWVLGAAVAQAIYVVLQKPLLRRYSALQFTTYAIWAGTLGLLIFAGGWSSRRSPPPPPPRSRSSTSASSPPR